MKVQIRLIVKNSVIIAHYFECAMRLFRSDK